MKQDAGFSIGFIASAPEIQEEGWLALWGEIRVGNHRERFLASLELWSRAQYESHWNEAARRIVAGADSTTFVTSAFQFWWPMWRSERHLVVHEQLLWVGEGVGRAFAPERNLFEQVGPYGGPLSTSGEPVSEWYLTVEDVARWLDRPPSTAGPA